LLRHRANPFAVKTFAHPAKCTDDVFDAVANTKNHQHPKLRRLALQLQVENDVVSGLQHICPIAGRKSAKLNGSPPNQVVLALIHPLAIAILGAILTCMGKRSQGALLILAVAAVAGLTLSNHAAAFSTEEHNRTGLRDCDCRAQGALWRQGHELCINGQMQVCTMEQNVSAWKPLGRTCPTAGLFTPRPRVKL
jgi:hypothetical protein